MNKKLTAVICMLALLMLPLYGCQLAKADEGEDLTGDRLIGAFITREYLDLFDFDAYFNNNTSLFTKGGDVTIDSSDARYNGRIYATLKTITLTSEETGETVEHEEFEFEGLDGIPFFAATVPATDTHEAYVSATSGGLVSDVFFSVGTETALEGTVYAVPDGKDVNYDELTVFYLNPVYQSGDGSVYLTSGQGISSSGITDEGAVMSLFLEETYATTVNGETSTEGFSIKVNFAIRYAAEKIAVVQMDLDSNPLSREEYDPDAMPESLTLRPDCEYLIVETRATNPNDGTATFKREIVQSGADRLTVYLAEGGICMPVSVELLW